ncbi:NADH:flavin oxidoreductase, partial [Burkholderia cenocepacia]|nr:NADH:flavin oxidoreductase [Burkholderia cenocepacia]
AVGRDLAVVCKIGVTEGVRGGGTADDACEIARRLEAEGAHLLVLSGGMNVESVWQLFGSPLPGDARANADNAIVRAAMALQTLTEPKMGAFREMYFLEHSKQVRAAVRIPLAYLGGVRSRDNVARAMREGFDAVALARALVFEPGFVNGLRDGRLAQSGCTSCNRCVVSMYTPGGTACVLREPNDPAPNRVPAAGA